MEHICKKCGERISYEPNTAFCTECGRTYHTWCWKSLPNCLGCEAENKEYSPEEAMRIAKNQERVNEIANAQLQIERKNGCNLCKEALGMTNTMRCPDCGKLYHQHCSLKIDKCTQCGCASAKFIKAENIISHTTNYVQDSGMFANIGEKIKNLAIFITVIGIVAGIIVFIANAAMEMFLTGLLTGLAIGLCSWIGSFAAYGFGALISSSQNTERLLSELIDTIEK